MATVLGQLIWEIMKKNNSFLVKEFGRSHVCVRFTKEPNNLLNLHSYKHSGLANKKTVTIQGVGKDQSEFRRMAKAVANQFYAAVITFVMKESETVPVRRVCNTGDLDLQTINSMHSNGGKCHNSHNGGKGGAFSFRLGFSSRFSLEAEQVSADWPFWLSAAADEAIYG
ncbi:hypothetical protein ACFX13_013356 [Malus domestica]